MAGTIVASLNCSVVNGTFTADPNVPTVEMVQTNAGGGNPGTVTVTTSEGDITIGLTTPGICIIQNIDPTNYVEYGPKSGGAMVVFGKIKPGEFAFFRFGASVTLRCKANTASVKLRIQTFED